MFYHLFHNTFQLSFIRPLASLPGKGLLIDDLADNAIQELYPLLYNRKVKLFKTVRLTHTIKNVSLVCKATITSRFSKLEEISNYLINNITPGWEMIIIVDNHGKTLQIDKLGSKKEAK